MHNEYFRSNIELSWQVHWQENDDWDPPPLHFNISHTSSLVACGVTVNSEVSNIIILVVEIF